MLIRRSSCFKACLPQIGAIGCDRPRACWHSGRVRLVGRSASGTSRCLLPDTIWQDLGVNVRGVAVGFLLPVHWIVA